MAVADFQKIKQKLEVARSNGKELFNSDEDDTLSVAVFIEVVRVDAELTDEDASDEALAEAFDAIHAVQGGEGSFHEKFTDWLSSSEPAAEVEPAEPAAAGWFGGGAEDAGAPKVESSGWFGGADEAAEVEASSPTKPKSEEKKETSKNPLRADASRYLTSERVAKIRMKLKAKAYDSTGLNVARLHRYFDRDRNGTLSFAEFLAAVRRNCGVPAKEVPDRSLKMLFREFDKDSSGTITLNGEFMEWLLQGGALDHGNLSAATNATFQARIHAHKIQKLQEQDEELYDSVRRRLNAITFRGGKRCFKEVFTKWDADCSRGIDMEEFRIAMKRDAKAVAAELTDEKVDRLFRMMDFDKDGTIDFQELVEFLNTPFAAYEKKLKTGRMQTGASTEATERTVRRRNTALKETVSLIRKRFMAGGYGFDGTDLNNVFRHYDKNSNNQLKWEEFRTAVRKEAKITKVDMDDQRLQRLFNKVDCDGTGYIDIDEFVSFITRSNIAKASEQDSDEAPGDSCVSLLGPDWEPQGDEEIDKVISLVRSQNEEIARLRSEQSRELRRLKMEHDVLSESLHSAGAVSKRSLGMARERQKEDPGMRPRGSSTPNSTSCPSSPLQKTSPLASDLYSLMEPLLLRDISKSDRAAALARARAGLEQGLDPDTWTGPGTPLRSMQRMGDEMAIKALLDNRADVNLRDANGVSVLHSAVYDGQLGIIKLLLDSSAEPNTLDRLNQTPLHFAPTRSICELLSRARADINCANTRGQPPLHLAAKAGLAEVLTWMSHHVPRSMLDLRDEEGMTAEDHAVKANVRSEVMHRLRTWEPRLLAQTKALKEDDDQEGLRSEACSRKLRLWELAHAERERRHLKEMQEGTGLAADLGGGDPLTDEDGELSVKVTIVQLQNIPKNALGKMPDLFVECSLAGKPKSKVRVLVNQKTLRPRPNPDVTAHFVTQCSHEGKVNFCLYNVAPRPDALPFATAHMKGTQFENGFEGAVRLVGKAVETAKLPASMVLKVECENRDDVATEADEAAAEKGAESLDAAPEEED